MTVIRAKSNDQDATAAPFISDTIIGKRVIRLVYLYPLLWALGLGALFWVLCMIVTLPRLLRGKLSGAGLASLVVALALFASAPVGLIAFGFEMGRAFGLVGNAAIWVSLAALLSMNHASHLAKHLARGLVLASLFQGAITFLAVQLQPAQLPIPLLADYSSQLPAGIAAFTRNSLVRDGWLGEATLRSSGISGNPVWAGALAAIAILICLHIVAYDTAKWKTVAFLALPFSYYSLDLSLSRSALLILLGSLVIVVVAWLRKSSKLGGSFAVYLLLAGVAGVVAIFGSEILTRFSEINAQRAGSALSRVRIYETTLEHVQDLWLPILGFGIKPNDSDLVASIATHSTYIGMLFRAGLLGSGALLVLLVLLLRRTFRDSGAVPPAVVVFVIVWCTIGDLDAGHLLPIGFVWACWFRRSTRSSCTMKSRAAPNAMSRDGSGRDFHSTAE